MLCLFDAYMSTFVRRLSICRLYGYELSVWRVCQFNMTRHVRRRFILRGKSVRAGDEGGKVICDGLLVIAEVCIISPSVHIHVVYTCVLPNTLHTPPICCPLPVCVHVYGYRAHIPMNRTAIGFIKTAP